MSNDDESKQNDEARGQRRRPRGLRSSARPSRKVRPVSEPDGQPKPSGWKEEPRPFPNFGAGLFTTDDDHEAEERLYLACAERLGESKTQTVRPQMFDVVRNYRADRDYDNQATFVAVKAKVLPLVPVIAKLLEGLDRLTPAARWDLNWSVKRTGSATDIVEIATAVLKDLKGATDRTVGRTYGKLSATAVKNCCSKLLALWEEAEKKPFARTWDYAEGADGPEFVSDGALFVQVAIKAIDPEVKFTKVHSSLKRLPRRDKSEKK